jgi:hypothetical protein
MWPQGVQPIGKFVEQLSIGDPQALTNLVEPLPVVVCRSTFSPSGNHSRTLVDPTAMGTTPMGTLNFFASAAKLALATNNIDRLIRMAIIGSPFQSRFASSLCQGKWHRSGVAISRN